MNNNLVQQKLPTEGYVRQAELLKRVLPISSATLWRMVKSGEFPSPVKLSTRVSAWRWVDVQRWMQLRETEELA